MTHTPDRQRWDDDRLDRFAESLERGFERLLEAQSATQVQINQLSSTVTQSQTQISQLSSTVTQSQASTDEQLEFLGRIMGQMIDRQEESDRRHAEHEARFNVLLGEVRALGQRIDSVLGLLNTNGHSGNGNSAT